MAISLGPLQGSQINLQGGSTGSLLQPAVSPIPQGFVGPILQPAATAPKIQPAATAPTLQPTVTAQQLQPSTGGVPVSRQTPAPYPDMVFGFADGSLFNTSGTQLQAATRTPTTYSSPPPPTPSYTPPTNGMVKGVSETLPPFPTYNTSSLSNLENDVSKYLQLSPEEEQAQTELNNLIASTRQGYTNIDNKVIPMEFITGQQRALEQRATDLAIPLQQRLALAQAKRQTSLDASKFALSREDARLDRNKPLEIGAGATLIDPATGKVIYQNPAQGQYSLGFDPLTGSPYVLNARTGQLSGGSSFGGTSGLSLSGGGFPSGAQTPGSAAAVNNPLGIKPGGKFAEYASPEEGFQAGIALVQRYQTGGPAGMNANSTLNQMINTWITGNPNNTRTTGYTATNVAQYLSQLGVSGVTPNTPIGQIDSTALAAAIAHFETGYSAGTGNSSDPVTYYGQQVQRNPQIYNQLTEQAQKLAQEYFRRSGLPFPNTTTLTGEALNKQTALNQLEFLIKQTTQLGEQLNWSGIGGLYQGSISQWLAKNFGTGSVQEQQLRSLISNITATLAKERGGTSFTPNEQELLERYTPTINDSPLVIQAKLANLINFISGSRTASSTATGGYQQPSSNDPLGLGI